MKIINKILKLHKIIPVFLIEIYQKYISKLKIQNRCIFYPTCSEYTKQAILKYGFFYGTFKGVKRIIRCNPFSKGGIDYLK